MKDLSSKQLLGVVGITAFIFGLTFGSAVENRGYRNGEISACKVMLSTLVGVTKKWAENDIELKCQLVNDRAVLTVHSEDGRYTEIPLDLGDYVVDF